MTAMSRSRSCASTTARLSCCRPTAPTVPSAYRRIRSSSRASTPGWCGTPAERTGLLSRPTPQSQALADEHAADADPGSALYFRGHLRARDGLQTDAGRRPRFLAIGVPRVRPAPVPAGLLPSSPPATRLWLLRGAILL